MNTNQPHGAATPAVVPRWEWRTFGDLADEDPAFASLRAVQAEESHDRYVLSMYADASVKVRAGLLDAKVLQRVNRGGLQLWVPTMKARFPVDQPTLVAVFDALGAPMPTDLRAHYDHEEFLDELVGTRSDLRVVETHKRRRRSLLDGCMVELSDFTVNGWTTRTLAAESPDPDLVIRTVRRLGFEGRLNTCVAAGLKSLLDWGPRRFAVIDIGTNSVTFLRGERRDAEESSIEVDTAIVTRLGEGLAESGELSPTAIGRTVDAIDGLITDARQGGPVSIVAVGTAGLRQAANSDTFLEAVHDRCGVTVEVISGVDEARMAYRAAVSALPLTGDRLLVFDSGGGSTQFTLGTATGIDEQFSVDVGAVRVAEHFGLADAVPRDTVDAALRAIADDLDRLRRGPRPDMVIAIGGTATNLAAHQHRLDRYNPAVVHGTLVDLAEVDRQIETYRQLSADARRDLPGLQPARAEVILAGACIVRTVLTHTGQQAMTVSDRGLRHGVAVERFGGALGS